MAKKKSLSATKTTTTTANVKKALGLLSQVKSQKKEINRKTDRFFNDKVVYDLINNAPTMNTIH